MTTQIESTQSTLAISSQQVAEKEMSAVQGLMHNLVLFHQQVAASSETKELAFSARTQNLQAIIQQLEAEREVLNRQLMEEESAITKMTMTHTEKKAALDAKVPLLKSQIQDETQLFETLHQEIAQQEAAYKQKVLDFANEQARGPALTQQNQALSLQLLQLQTRYASIFRTFSNYGLRL